jgi:hypothetical protein
MQRLEVSGAVRHIYIYIYVVRWQMVKQLDTLPALHFNRCLETEYSETTANFNGNVL